MLPILELDFAALCGCEGDFFSPENRLVGAQAALYRWGALPPWGKLPNFLVSFIAENLDEHAPPSPLLFLYAPMGMGKFALLVAAPEVPESSFCPWLNRWPNCEREQYIRIPAHATPFLLWQAPFLTWLHRLESDQSPQKLFVEDWGNPLGVVNEETPRTLWKECHSIYDRYYVPVPHQPDERESGGVVVNHAFYRAPVESLG